MTGINLQDHDAFIVQLMNKYGIPPEMQEDYYQDFYEYWLRYSHYDETKGKPTTYIDIMFFSMLSRKAEEYKRHKYRVNSEAHNLEDLESAIDKEYSCYGPEDFVYLQEVVNKLPPTMKEKYLNDKTDQEIADVKGVHRYTICVRLSKERERLKRRLK